MEEKGQNEMHQALEDDAGRVDHRHSQGEIQSALAVIWSEVLRVSDIGPDADFFHLGGDSLAAMQIASRVSHRFGIRMRTRDLFEHHVLIRYATILVERLNKNIERPR